MEDTKNLVQFKNNEKYKVGAVTYDVTAHFLSDNETLKSKLSTLILSDLRKTKTDAEVRQGRSDEV